MHTPGGFQRQNLMGSRNTRNFCWPGMW
jgi:hypothetical protein